MIARFWCTQHNTHAFLYSKGDDLDRDPCLEIGNQSCAPEGLGIMQLTGLLNTCTSGRPAYSHETLLSTLKEYAGQEHYDRHPDNLVIEGQQKLVRELIESQGF